MHDPKTVAFDFKLPWFGAKKLGMRPYISLLTIWHVDPELDNDEDSCGWHWPHLTEEEHAKARDLAYSKVDNLLFWFDEKATKEDVRWRIVKLFRILKRMQRPWYRHPRFHVRHWDLQWHLVQRFKRYMFSRCYVCDQGFTWEDAAGRVIGRGWHGNQPAWFYNAESIRHMGCSPASAPCAQEPR
jgi:hypothetical protein